MRETADLRFPEDRARKYLRDDEGKVLGSPEEIALVGPSVRQLIIDTSTPRYREIGQAYRTLMLETGQSLFYGWDLTRRYTRQETLEATLFRLIITAKFEPPGELCGTVFDESTACPVCRAGRRQVGDLILDLRKAPKSKDFGFTIAHDEWIVSQRLAEILVDAKMTGFELRPVHHKAYYWDDPVLLKRYAAGRELLRLAEAAGHTHHEWEYYVWLNRPEQQQLWKEAQAQRVAAKETHDRRSGAKPPPRWYQLVVTSRRVPIAGKAQFGTKIFEEDERDEALCPLGHVRGLGILSELYVEAGSWDGSDVAATQQMVGHRMGLLVPFPLLLISPRMRQLLADVKATGWRFEVAYEV